MHPHSQAGMHAIICDNFQNGGPACMLHKTLQVKMWVLAIVVSIDLTFVLLNIPRCSEGGMKGELEKKKVHGF